ncbi:rhomboid family intramembrane serine protease [Vallitalea sp.]|jgi:rhomboid protease GluP|uniref:rhomboid family intramembrane serine protease n=1 Tax=Vallitalea sp. TaxID=1882829 RepID=UPI0025DDB5D4|nr:rhomboid family intramembrane serine protease [Vallitalea sp.]MCT4687486.1 rhomboid family intramembrane serine protease [Vallitalea sp.]
MKTFTKICNIFDSYNYQTIPTDSKKVKMYATFNNSNLYLVNIISLDSAYTFSKERFKEYKVITKEQFTHIDSNKIILLNLIITENALDIYKDVNYTPDFDEDLIDINWIIDENEGKLIIPSMQVNSVIGIEKDIRKLLETNDESWGPKIIEENKNIPYITYGLIVINTIFFIYMERLGGTTNILNLVKFGAIDYYSFFMKGEYYRIITSMFIHIGALHLLYNTFSLFIFGTRIEKYMKKWEYILLYGISGICGGLLSITVDLVNRRPVVSAGASGAIYGIIGAILIYSKVYKKHIGGLNSYTILIMFIVGIAFGTMNLGINNLAHLGGFIGGAIVAYLLTLRKQA